jgi:hypothetical protein
MSDTAHDPFRAESSSPVTPATPIREFDVTDHTVDEVVAWVAGDKRKARAALNAETKHAADTKTEPRKTLVEQLETVLA